MTVLRGTTAAWWTLGFFTFASLARAETSVFVPGELIVTFEHAAPAGQTLEGAESESGAARLSERVSRLESEIGIPLRAGVAVGERSFVIRIDVPRVLESLESAMRRLLERAGVDALEVTPIPHRRFEGVEGDRELSARLVTELDPGEFFDAVSAATELPLRRPATHDEPQRLVVRVAWVELTRRVARKLRDTGEVEAVELNEIAVPFRGQ